MQVDVLFLQDPPPDLKEFETWGQFVVHAHEVLICDVKCLVLLDHKWQSQ